MPKFIGPELPPLHGPLFRVPCNGMHFEDGSPHLWLADRQHDLDELCGE